MDETIQTAFDGYVHSNWTIGQFQMFLRTHCINAECTSLILDHASNAKDLCKVNNDTSAVDAGVRERTLFVSQKILNILMCQKLLLSSVYAVLI